MASDSALSRTDTAKIKCEIVNKIGHPRANNYFDHLTRFLSLKISKCEFDKLCFRTLSKEHIPLHNLFIRSILKNASARKIVPSSSDLSQGSKISTKSIDECRKSYFWCLDGHNHLPSHPRKKRSVAARKHTFVEQKYNVAPLSSECEPNCVTEKQPSNAVELISPGSRLPVEVTSVEEGEEVEQGKTSPFFQSKSPVIPPLGISFIFGKGCSRSIANGSLSHKPYRDDSCLNSGFLPDTKLLTSRLQHMLQEEGIGVSPDCAALLNSGLDAYLKQLIDPCLFLARSKSRTDVSMTVNSLSSQLGYASPLDFQVAMESNPRLLGPYWSTQLEKISASIL